MTEKHRQARLSRKKGEYEEVLVCWLPSAGLKVGMRITLKHAPDEWWTISGLSTIELDKHLLHTDWKVGGLT